MVPAARSLNSVLGSVWLSQITLGFFAMSLTAGSFGQRASIATIKPGAAVKLEPVDAATVATAPKPVTPSDTLRAPLLPPRPGCAHLVGDAWEMVPCTPNSYWKTQPLRAVLANTIQSTPRTQVQAGGTPPHATTTSVVTSFTWGSVGFSQLSDPTQAMEVNVQQTLVGAQETPNDFSIQQNTNLFTCAFCSNGVPFAAVPGVAHSASQPGDQAAIQFVYFQFASGPPPAYGVSHANDAQLCIAPADYTVIENTAGAAGYTGFCVNPGASDSIAPLTGSGAPSGASELIAYVQCPRANSEAGCTLWTVAYLPWVSGSHWWAVSAPDSMGLAGRWTNMGGTVYGSGGGSQAAFSNAQLLQVLHVSSCTAPPGNGHAMPMCTAPKGVLASSYNLSASPATYTLTGESNNLTNGPVSFSCQIYDCWMAYSGTAP